MENKRDTFSFSPLLKCGDSAGLSHPFLAWAALLCIHILSEFISHPILSFLSTKKVIAWNNSALKSSWAFLGSNPTHSHDISGIILLYRAADYSLLADFDCISFAALSPLSI